MSSEPADLGPSPRRQAASLTMNLAAGAALGLFQSWFKEKVAADLDALPKPRIDRRSASSFLQDPDAAGGASLLDLFNKNMKPFQKELDDNHQKIMSANTLRFWALALKEDKSKADVEERFQELDAIDAELDDYDQLLGTVEDNLDSILEKEEQALKTKKAADDLRAWLKNGLVLDGLIRQGFSVEDIEAMDSNLAYLSSSVSSLMDEARATRQQVENLRQAVDTLRKSAKKVWWDEFGHQVQELIKERQAKRQQAWEAAKKQAEAEHPHEEPSERPAFRNSDEMGNYYYLRTREGEILREIEQLENHTPAEPDDEFEKRNDLLEELKRVRDQLRKYQPPQRRGFGPNDG